MMIEIHNLWLLLYFLKEYHDIKYWVIREGLEGRIFMERSYALWKKQKNNVSLSRSYLISSKKYVH